MKGYIALLFLAQGILFAVSAFFGENGGLSIGAGLMGIAVAMLCKEEE